MLKYCIQFVLFHYTSTCTYAIELNLEQTTCTRACRILLLAFPKFDVSVWHALYGLFMVIAVLKLLRCLDMQLYNNFPQPCKQWQRHVLCALNIYYVYLSGDLCLVSFHDLLHVWVAYKHKCSESILYVYHLFLCLNSY